MTKDESDALGTRIAVNNYRTRAGSMSTKARTTQEEWLRELGTKFVDVWLCVSTAAGGTEFVDERHVDDLTTLSATIKMSLERLSGRAAVYPYLGRWALYTPWNPNNVLRYYDTREAAEMVAIHHA